MRRQKEFEGRRSDQGHARQTRSGSCTREDCKQALRLLIDSERCVYSYFGGSYIELPHKEGAAPE